jgi:hypothetical protein
MIAIEPIIVPLAGAIASTLTDTDAIWSDRHISLGQRDRIARNGDGVCQGGEYRQAKRSRKYESKGFHEN